MEQLVDYFAQNHDKLLYTLAGIILVVELTVLGLGGPLLFIGIACAITGVFVTIGLLSSWQTEILSVGILSLVIAMTLWKPLKQLQGPRKVSDSSSDMIGQVVPVSEQVTRNGGSVRHSGINWQARLDASSPVDVLDSGERVEISAVEGNVMIVKTQSSRLGNP
jgi:membrane protein implicated in regulation of membrane protease activity